MGAWPGSKPGCRGSIPLLATMKGISYRMRPVPDGIVKFTSAQRRRLRWQSQSRIPGQLSVRIGVHWLIHALRWFLVEGMYVVSKERP